MLRSFLACTGIYTGRRSTQAQVQRAWLRHSQSTVCRFTVVIIDTLTLGFSCFWNSKSPATVGAATAINRTSQNPIE